MDTGGPPKSTDKCQLYLAESSIPNAGLGIYTAVPIGQGQAVYHPELVVGHFDYRHSSKMAHFFTEEESLEWKKVVGSKTDDDELCASWAKQGECKNNPNFMLDSCAKSCAVEKAGLELNKLLASKIDKDRNCNSWASEKGECESNAAFMLTTCSAACAAEAYGIKHLSEDLKKEWVPYHYYWEGQSTSSTFEAEIQLESLVPGVGALCNFHPGLVNVDIGRATVDIMGYHRASDVGAGAFSDRHSLRFEAMTHISAGMELFYITVMLISGAEKKRLGQYHFLMTTKRQIRLWRSSWKVLKKMFPMPKRCIRRPRTQLQKKK